MSICRVCGRELNQSQIVNYQGKQYKSCLNCSNRNGGEHVYYRYTEDFGTTEHRVTSDNPCMSSKLVCKLQGQRRYNRRYFM